MALSLLSSQVAWAQQDIGDAQKVVNDVKGVVGTKEPAVLYAGIDVFQNEVIRTGPRSASRIVFQDSTGLSVGSSSQVTLDRFVFDPDPAKSQVALSIAKGVARFATGSLPKSSYSITTPTATIGVRGTVLTVGVADDGATLIGVEDGTAIVTGAGVTVEVPAGMTTTVAPGQAPTSPQPFAAQPPPVVEMDYLLADNLLPAGPPGGAATGLALGAVPIGVAATATALVLVIVLLGGDSGSSTTTTASAP